MLEIDPIVEWMGLGCGRLKTLVMRLTLRGQSREVDRNVPFYILLFPVVSILQGERHFFVLQFYLPVSL